MVKALRRISLVLLASASVSSLAAADEYMIDPAHTSIVFSALRQGVVNVYGRFDKVDGSLVVDEDNPSASSINITIATESVDTNNERRDNHLRSPDFFNAQQFPEIVFKSTSVKKTGDGRYAVEGTLSLHGVVRPITADVVRTGAAENARRGTRSIGFETRFVIKRSEFEMNYMQDALSDEIPVTFSIHGVTRPAAAQ